MLLPAGLLISRSMQGLLPSASGSGLDPLGLTWALISVASFAAAGVFNRLVADKDWGAGLAIGLASLLASLVVADGGAARLHRCDQLGATTVALWGNGGVLVSLLSAHLLLGERLGPHTLVGAALILAALLVARRRTSSEPPSDH